MWRQAARCCLATSSGYALCRDEGCGLPATWTPCPLKRVVPHNHDTAVFVFATPDDTPLRLPVCGCIHLKAPGREHGGGDAVRPYTPIAEAASFDRLSLRAESSGEFALLVKMYREWGFRPEGQNETPAFAASYRPPGAVSTFVHEAPACAELRYGNVNFRYPFEGVDRVNMIAVGAGIAPMIQCLERLLFTPGDTTKVVLMYGNRSVKDVLLRETLDRWAREFPDRLTVVYCVGSRLCDLGSGAHAAAPASGF
ncbi:hypothetical protein CTAYLR_008681 [Chrysophaeum taylorii]|uniref:cytochrome-b5 reductase n=1 Tax=Chrysophaeum taylorii TaxID=2483200 RepID=A0AAD7XRV3_9STRA|nr:hypothetical protein CTAYLR_008681 [Chrysophaeum taylorii]